MFAGCVISTACPVYAQKDVSFLVAGCAEIGGWVTACVDGSLFCLVGRVDRHRLYMCTRLTAHPVQRRPSLNPSTIPVDRHAPCRSPRQPRPTPLLIDSLAAGLMVPPVEALHVRPAGGGGGGSMEGGGGRGAGRRAVVSEGRYVGECGWLIGACIRPLCSSCWVWVSADLHHIAHPSPSAIHAADFSIAHSPVIVAVVGSCESEGRPMRRPPLLASSSLLSDSWRAACVANVFAGTCCCASIGFQCGVTVGGISD